jgi:hypothetical protein
MHKTFDNYQSGKQKIIDLSGKYSDVWKKVDVLQDINKTDLWQVDMTLKLYQADKHRVNKISSICLSARMRVWLLFGNWKSYW